MNRIVWAALLVAVMAGFIPARAHAVQPLPVAGPAQPIQTDGGQVAGLSPNGAYLAILKSQESLCIVDAHAGASGSCVDLAAFDSEPAIDEIVWSPDSTRLAIAEIGLLLGRDSDLWVMDAATGALTNLTDDGYTGYLPTTNNPQPAPEIYVDSAPAWTPDGQFITFARSAWIDGAASGVTLAQVPATGGLVETLATIDPLETGIVSGHSGWLPDGSAFLYTRDSNRDTSQNGIWAYDAATGALALLASADDPALGTLSLLEISPAGDQLLAGYPHAKAMFDVDSPLLRLVDLGTGALTTPILPSVTSPSLEGMSVATFSPDGASLLILAPILGEQDQLWLATPATTDPVLLLAETKVETSQLVNWGTDGSVLVAGLYGQAALVPISMPAAAPAPAPVEVTTFTPPAGQPLAVSPDGSKLAVLDPYTSLCVYALDTQQQLSCASLEDQPVRPRGEDVVWSPDGTRLAFTERGYEMGDDSDLWVMDAASGTLTNLTDDGYDGPLISISGANKDVTFWVDSSPAWTPDSQFISVGRSEFVNGKRGGTTLVRVPAAGGPAEELAVVSDTEAGVIYYRSAWSADGTTLYYTYDTSYQDDPAIGIWALDAASGTLTHLVPREEWRGSPMLLQVSPAGNSLLVWYPEVLRGSDIAAPLVQLIDTATGEPLPLELPPPDQATLPARILAAYSPDGTQLAFLLVPTGGVGQLWTADLDTGVYTRLADTVEGALLDPLHPPTWAANVTLAVPTVNGSVVVLPSTAPAMSLRELVEQNVGPWRAALDA